MGSESGVHVLVVSFPPSQGNVNPLLSLAKCLASKGLLVTFCTTELIGQMMQKYNSTTNTNTITTIADGQLRFEFFSDGSNVDELKCYELDALMQHIDKNTLMQQMETVGKDSFTHLINKQANEGRPVSCIISNPFTPWALDVAAELGIPSAVLWIHSCAVYSAYYHYFHGLASFPTITQPHLPVHLPAMPVLNSDEIPSFLHPSSPYVGFRDAILGQFKNLSKAFCVLVDSFQELEHEIIESLSHHSPLKPIGPLFKSPHVANNSIRGDMWRAADDCLQWLDSKPQASVVYIAFGSNAILKEEQMEEIACGLLNTGLSFLFVVRSPPKQLLDEESGFIKEAQGKWMVVQWCPQEKVLAHPSIACFVTHCGWNSSLESLSSGVPIVALPQWGDQVTDAKFLVDVYRVGVRMGRGENDGKLASREDLERCLLQVTRGPKAEEMKRNALKLKKAVEEVVAEGGSSDRNIQAFVDEIRGMAFKSCNASYTLF
ncbi:hypothetical protein HHK36_030337 [Tetracentron sinense]|uniref:Glycosyltransferase n=1 Tax=Tetracentron sinense TaxID=13715 RepID=A0A834YBY2_TETSI|nr:hypothetical protein HHK36_030337 [Tetracentron sinense]